MNGKGKKDTYRIFPVYYWRKIWLCRKEDIPVRVPEKDDPMMRSNPQG